MKKLLTFAAVLAGLALAAACGPSKGTVRSFDVFLSADSSAVLHAFLPEKPSGRAVVCLPGGGYSHLAVDHEGRDWQEFFCPRGIALFVLEYRMPGGDRTIPMGDALNALRTVREHAAEWKVNPRDVGIMGSSAGGHLAAVTSVLTPLSERPAFQILFYPVITMDLWGGHEGSSRNFLGADVDNPDTVAAFSAHENVPRHNAPPAIIFLSADDNVVPAGFNGVPYAQAMLLAENPVVMHMYPDGGHGWGYRSSFACHGEMLESLGRWLDALPSVREDAVKVACIGDSITDGHEIFPAWSLGYPAVLQGLLGDGYEVRNFGLSARTLQNGADIPYMAESIWRECLDFRPDVAVIKLGTNDSKPWNRHGREPLETDLQQMVDALKALPSAPRILLCTPVPVFENPYQISEEAILEDIAPAIRAVAERNGLEIIDLHSAVSDRALFQPDGVHPNARGAAAMASAVAAAL